MNYGCEGLTAVITGGTSGIGLATAKALLEDGAKVFLLGRSLERGQVALATLKQATACGERATFIPCDVTQKESCKKAEQRILEVQQGQLQVHILVNSAGIYKEERLETVREEDYDKIFNTNVKGTLLVTQTFLPYMYAGAGIVNIASDAGISGNYGCPVYCASKGAVVALTKALALDLAPKIRINCVCPADVDTPLLTKQLQENGASYSKEDMAQEYPLERIGKAEEIAHVICSLAAPANSFMTGSIIAVDGGLTAK